MSLSPEEAFEGVGSGSQESGRPNFGFASGPEADVSFVEAEEQRRQTASVGNNARDTYTATVSPNTLYGGWSVDADLPGGLGLPKAIRNKIIQRVESNVDASPEETPGWKSVATVTVSKPSEDASFNASWRIESIDYSEGDTF